MRCFRTRGKKGDEHLDPADPPRRRANKKRGRGTYDNDRPPIIGTVGRESGQVRLRVVKDTTGETLSKHVHQFTQDEALINTDDYQSYNAVQRERDTVCHSDHEWARDDDGDGFFEIHTNTTEGLWAAVRTFLRVFRGVHKRYLSGYIAICEFSINLKRVTPDFISALVCWQFAWA